MTQATLSAPPPTQTARRLVCFPTNVSTPNNFGVIRLLLSVLVILSHSAFMAHTNGHDILGRWSRGQANFGDLAVDWFFAISGFLITSSWEQTAHFGAYLRKRALRIFPGLIAAVLFCVLVVGPLGGAHLATYFRDPQTYRFAQIALLQDVAAVDRLTGVFHNNISKDWVNGSLWTIRYEFLCYLLVPAVVICGLLRRRFALLALFLVLLVAFHHSSGILSFAIAHVVAHGDDKITTVTVLPRLLLFFLAGVTFYAWRDRIPRSPALLIVALAALAASNGHDVHSERLNLTLPVAGTYIIFYAAYARSLAPALTRLAQKHDLSYGVYLYGFPVQQLLVHYAMGGHVGWILTPLGLFACALPPALGLALLSWNYVEKPFLKLKTARRAQPVSAMGVLDASAAAGAA